MSPSPALPSPPVVWVQLPDPQGMPVTVSIDAAAAVHLLQQFVAVFAWPTANCDALLASAAPDRDTDLSAFAQQVLTAAQQVPATGYGGPGHLFIEAVWLAWQANGGTLSLSVFKQCLSACAASGLVKLATASLAHTLNVLDLARSEWIDAQGTIYHFLVLTAPVD